MDLCRLFQIQIRRLMMTYSFNKLGHAGVMAVWSKYAARDCKFTTLFYTSRMLYRTLVPLLIYMDLDNRRNGSETRIDEKQGHVWIIPVCIRARQPILIIILE